MITSWHNLSLMMLQIGLYHPPISIHKIINLYKFTPMPKAKPTAADQVIELITHLEKDVSDIVQEVRKLVLNTNVLIAEHVKWNSMSFYYSGEMQAFDAKSYQRDLLVCNVHRGKILLIFPTGAKIKDNINGKDYPDGRKIIAITGLVDLKIKAEAIQQIIKDWLNQIIV